MDYDHNAVQAAAEQVKEKEIAVDDSAPAVCEICDEDFSEEKQDTQPLMLSCPCRKVMCRGCILKRLQTNAFCPWCKQRWPVRQFINTCESITPHDYYSQIRAKAASNDNSSPLRMMGNLVPLGAGILRDYYLKSMEVVQRDAEARSAEQIQVDEELARQYDEERQLKLQKLRQLEEEDAKLAQSLAGGSDQQNVNSSSSSSSSSSSDNRRKESTRLSSSSGVRTTTSSSSSSSSGLRRSSKPPNNGSSLLTFFAKDDGSNSSNSNSNSSNQNSLNNCVSSPTGIDENQHPILSQSGNKECINIPSSLGKKRPVISDHDVSIIGRANSNSHSSTITSKSKEQKPVQKLQQQQQMVVSCESHSQQNKRPKPRDELEQQWVCTVCTYAYNPALYLLCDCCQAERRTTNASASTSSSTSSSSSAAAVAQENDSHLAF